MKNLSNVCLDIDPSWNFNGAVKNIRALRDTYEHFLTLFSYLDLHEEVEFKRRTRNAFYALNLPEWQIDKLWNYMNHFEFYYVLKGIANRQNVK